VTSVGSKPSLPTVSVAAGAPPMQPLDERTSRNPTNVL